MIFAHSIFCVSFHIHKGMASSVSFYSAKAKMNVAIPAKKVCGYRIANDVMKDGFSDGVKTGADNGVVAQKLSRFSTQEEREKSSADCKGNTNWLNYRRGQSFNKPENADKQFSLARPSFKAGTFNRQEQPAQSIDTINMRNGTGNYNIERDNFLAPDIKGRRVPAFAELQAMAVSEAGTIIGSQFGSKLSAKATIRVPDATDFEWLREKDRLSGQLTATYQAVLKADGSRFYSDPEIKAFVAKEISINKPLGRDQRYITKTTDDIANSTLSTSKKIDEIAQEVKEGRAESLVQQRAITAQLIQILNESTAFVGLTQANLDNMELIIPRIGLPTHYSQFGLTARFIDKVAFNKTPGMISLLLLSRIRTIPQSIATYNQPVINSETGALLNLESMSRAIRNDPPKFLDLEDGVLIRYSELLRQFKSGNFSPNDFDIDPAIMLMMNNTP